MNRASFHAYPVACQKPKLWSRPRNKQRDNTCADSLLGNKPDRHAKHLVVRLTNAVTSMDICVVHLRRPLGSDGIEKQKNQCRALLKWAMRHLSGDPKANLVILGDFNEGHPVGSDSQALDVLFQAKPPLVGTLSTLSGKISTHAAGKAYDRILVSDAIAKGLNRLKLERVVIQPHRHGKGEERRLYTDHFSVVMILRLGR